MRMSEREDKRNVPVTTGSATVKLPRTQMKERKVSARFPSIKCKVFVYAEHADALYPGVAVVLMDEHRNAWVGVSYYSETDRELVAQHGPIDARKYGALPYTRKEGRTRAFGHAVKAFIRRPGSPDGTVEGATDEEQGVSAMWLGKMILEGRKRYIHPFGMGYRDLSDNDWAKNKQVKATDPMRAGV